MKLSFIFSNLMDNLDSFQTLLEIMVLVLTLAGQSPWLGMIAGLATLVWLLFADGGDRGF